MRIRFFIFTFLLVAFGYGHSSQGQDVQFIEMPDGAQIAYRVIGEGPPVLFIHGFFGRMTHWDALAGSLVDDFKIVMVDLRGHGDSTNPTTQHDHRQFGRDSAELMKALGIDHYGIVGHSSGGITAYHMSLLYPERIKWHVVIGSSPKLAEPQREMLRSFPDYDDMPAWLQEAINRYQPRGREQIETLTVAFRELGTERSDMNFGAEDLAKISTPTLVVWGDRDDYPVETAVFLYRNLQNATLWVVPGVGHQVFWPEFDERAAIATLEFAPRIREFASLNN